MTRSRQIGNEENTGNDVKNRKIVDASHAVMEGMKTNQLRSTAVCNGWWRSGYQSKSCEKCKVEENFSPPRRNRKQRVVRGMEEGWRSKASHRTSRYTKRAENWDSVGGNEERKSDVIMINFIYKAYITYIFFYNRLTQMVFSRKTVGYIHCDRTKGEDIKPGSQTLIMREHIHHNAAMGCIYILRSLKDETPNFITRKFVDYQPNNGTISAEYKETVESHLQ